MTPLNKESMQSKINRIRQSLVDLQELAQMSYSEYVKNRSNMTVAERLLETSIQSMLDIGSHIIAEEGFGDPQEYRDVFAILTKAKILPPKQEAAFLNMVGLRNRIVHLYESIDHKLIHQFLKNNLGDFDVFLKAVTKYIQ